MAFSESGSGGDPQRDKGSEIIPSVPEEEMHFDAARSGGPGGQNVNKVSSKVILRWAVGESTTFNDEQKAAIREAAGKHLNKEDVLVIQVDTTRSQVQNREQAIRRLQELVATALLPRKERKSTSVTRGEKEKRLQEKHLRSQQKHERQIPENEW